MRSSINNQTVLVSGINGFIAMHIAVLLLRKGYTVRGTLRNLDNTKKVSDLIRTHAPVDKLDFVKAELTNPDDWLNATKDIDYVQHVASPLPVNEPKDRNEVIVPAKEGALNVLKAAKTNGIKRVVLTSSVAAIGYGVSRNGTFTEADWSDPTNKKDVSAYTESKTVAEKAAWEFYENNQPFELVAINPSYVLGELIDLDISASALVIKKLLDGKAPGAPKLNLNIVDVRDVAEMHVMAMEHPDAVGKRFICSSGVASLLEISKILKANYPAYAKKVPGFEVPNFVVRLIAIFDKQIARIVNSLGTHRVFDNTQAMQVLGWSPRSVEDAVNATAGSMIKMGIV